MRDHAHKAQTGGSINDEALYRKLFMGACIERGGTPIIEDLGMFQTSRKCRFPISGRGLSMMICGIPISKERKASYCKKHHALCYYPASRRLDAGAVRAGEHGTRVVERKEEPIVDLLGQEVEQGNGKVRWVRGEGKRDRASA